LGGEAPHIDVKANLPILKRTHTKILRTSAANG
jgi:hypothetical protein